MKESKRYNKLLAIVVIWVTIAYYHFLLKDCYAHERLEFHHKIVTAKLFIEEQRNSGEEITQHINGNYKHLIKNSKKKYTQNTEAIINENIEFTKNQANMQYNMLVADEDILLKGANDRIEKIRKGRFHIKILDYNGNNLSTTEVKIKQTSHDFLFGANHSIRLWSAIADYIAERNKGKGKRDNYNNNVSNQDIENLIKNFIEVFNYTTLPVYWKIYEPEKGYIRSEVYDNVIYWLKEKNFRIRTEGLIWNSMNPYWLPSNCMELKQIIVERIAGFLKHYGNRIDYYTIINEAAHPFRPLFKDDNITKCYRQLGKITIPEVSFEVARKILPYAKLAINEAAINPKGPFPDLLRQLKDKNEKYVFDIIGLQAHMHGRLWELENLWKICDYYSTFKKPIHITELTVLSGTPISGNNYGKVTTKEGELKQKEYVTKLYKLLFSHPAVEGIQWWDLSDLMAWRDAPAGLLRKNMQPKPAFNAIRHLILNEWNTNLTLKTDKNAKIEFSGFYGEYNIKIKDKNEQENVFTIHLGKENQKIILLRLKARE